MQQIDAIIQARVGSTRLPYKILINIFGKTVLHHLIDRVSKINSLDNIIIAIPDSQANDILEFEINEIHNQRVHIFRGDENDVLDRYYNAAYLFGSDIVVRVTSDCPLLDPRVSESVIKYFLDNDCNFCYNSKPPTFPLGLDTQVFDFNSLEEAWKNASLQHQREHVVPYILENPSKFKILNMANPKDLSNLRWTLDYPEDMEYIIEIYKRLYKSNEIFYMEDILDILEREPYLNNINRHLGR